MSTVVAGDEFRNYIERLEKIQAERKQANSEYGEMFGDIINEMRSKGYDVKAVKEVIRLRSKDPDEIAELESILDVYKAALGMN